MYKIDFHLRERALTGMDDECGDIGIVRVCGSECFMALIDVLGHGKAAFDIAVRAKSWLLDHYQLYPDLVALMKGLHAHLKGSRGAVATLCRLNLATGVLTYSGIGNISMRLFGRTHQRFLSKDGIVGYVMSSPMEKQGLLHPGEILVLSSDGIKEHFNVDDFPELLMGRAEEITARFFDLLGKNSDDASCIVLRYGI